MWDGMRQHLRAAMRGVPSRQVGAERGMRFGLRLWGAVPVRVEELLDLQPVALRIAEERGADGAARAACRRAVEHDALRGEVAMHRIHIGDDDGKQHAVGPARAVAPRSQSPTKPEGLTRKMRQSPWSATSFSSSTSA